MEPNNPPSFTGMDVNKINQTQPTGNGTGKIVAVIVAILLLAGIAYAGWIYVKNNNVVEKDAAMQQVEVKQTATTSQSDSLDVDLDYSGNIDYSQDAAEIDKEF